jgi:hypothetical protein
MMVSFDLTIEQLYDIFSDMSAKDFASLVVEVDKQMGDYDISRSLIRDLIKSFNHDSIESDRGLRIVAVVEEDGEFALL